MDKLNLWLYVPEILKSGNRRLVVNALLDDASTKSDLNADVAAELALQGKLQKMTVNVLHGLESVDKNIDMNISVFHYRESNWKHESN